MSIRDAQHEVRPVCLGGVAGPLVSAAPCGPLVAGGLTPGLHVPGPFGLGDRLTVAGLLALAFVGRAAAHVETAAGAGGPS